MDHNGVGIKGCPEGVVFLIKVVHSFTLTAPASEPEEQIRRSAEILARSPKKKWTFWG
jgi:hypothetical protein